MLSLIVYLVMLASAWVVVKHGPGRALLWVYLPALLLLPDSFEAAPAGIPHLNFNQCAIVPILLGAAWREMRSWRPNLMDAGVLLFSFWIGYSDLMARGYSDAQNMMYSMACSVVAPYFVARWVIPREKLDIAVAKRFAFLVFVVGVIGCWEFRMGFNPFYATLDVFFPGQGLGWVTTFRHGVARVAGPYSHAILAGIMMVIAYRIHRWLQRHELWEPRFARLPAWPWSKAATMTVALFMATLMTVARGPWLGAIAAAAIVAVGQARNRRRALWIAGVTLLGAAVVGYFVLADYLNIQPGSALTASQESALYRKILFEKYFDIALEHAWFGWGLTTWPKVPGMTSIDNYYLLLSLMHGVPAMLILVSMLLGGCIQSLVAGLRTPTHVPTPAFMFAGIFVAIFISLGTVYLGEQVLPTLFFCLGWSQGLNRWNTPSPLPTSGTPSPQQPARTAGFRAVIE